MSRTARVSRTGRPPVGLAATGLLLTALVAGCSAGPAPRSAPSTGAGETWPATAASTAAPPEPATTTPPVPYRTGPPPAGPPAPLAAVTPTGPDGWSARFWFGGVLLGRERGKLLVAYPAIETSSDGAQVVAHAKIALFRCIRRKAPGNPDFLGCTDRRVEYGDLAAPELRVTRTGAGALTLTGEFTTYVYGTAVDRGPGPPPRWTGRTFPLWVSCTPGTPEPGPYGGFAGTASVSVGPATSRGRARLDLGYPNRQVR